MKELEITTCSQALEYVRAQLADAPQTEQVGSALQTLQAMVEELAAWKTLKNPQILHSNLLKGFPASLSKASLLHLVGAPECSNAGRCKHTQPLG